jgi:putative transposase
VGSASPSYRGHRYSVEVISHCVWLYFRFPLSFREVEELMLERGVIVSYETIRRWCMKFGQQYANSLRRRQPRPGDKWHLDEVFIKINGEQKYLWRLSTRTAWCWTSWCRTGGTRPRPDASSADS